MIRLECFSCFGSRVTKPNIEGVDGKFMAESLGEAIEHLDVENVFIYVGDAVRWDFRPDAVTDQGPTLRTVSASIHSPAAFASLVTGVHPPRHGVFSFEDTFGNTPRVFDLGEYQTRFVNSVIEDQDGADPIFSVLGVEPGSTDPFADLSTPFIVMERGPGGHAPYAEAETAAEYFRLRDDTNRDTLQKEYRSAIERDVDLFFDRLTSLEERGLRNDTLVIYTSDHGELLGEGGSVGHNAPMRPELVHVPTTFIHPALPETVNEGMFRHVDLVPTVLAALDNRGALGDVDGEVVGRSSAPGLSFYANRIVTSRSGLSVTLSYDGVWTANGGHVFARSNRLERLAALGGKLLKSPKRGYLRRHIGAALQSYLAGDQTYGNPDVTRNDSERILSETYDDATIEGNRGESDSELSDEAIERLEDMGYI